MDGVRGFDLRNRPRSGKRTSAMDARSPHRDEPPFTDSAPNGVSDMFGDAVVTQIVNTIEQFEPRMDAAL